MHVRRFLAGAAVALCASVAFGGLKVKVGDHADRAAGFSGGVFAALDMSDGVSKLPEANWATFCIESNEFINLGSTYNAQINTAAINGGSGGGSPDPLDPRTAFLYQTYRTNPAALNGSLSGGASFTGTQAERQAATKQLQQAIWWLEQETGGANNGLVTLAAGSGWTDIGNVRVLNLFTLNGDGSWNHHQDMLILVPAPAAALLAVIGLGASAWLKRRSL